ncbi:MAG: dihydroorotate dehydrogenase [Acidimicrobiia bacterium]
MADLAVDLGPVSLKTPLVAAAGTVGSVVDFTGVTDFSFYGAAVAKSVSGEPWTGRPAPRVGPAGVGMLNGIGIQNPGIDAWVEKTVPALGSVPTQVWGSAVGNTPDEFATVAAGYAGAGLSAIEVNLSCPNLDGHMFALSPALVSEVVSAVRAVVDVPIGAKLSPNSEDIVSVAAASAEAGADWVVLTNTAWGAGIDIHTRKPTLSGVIGGYSGIPIKPLALRCVIEVHRALPELPILGCGGIASGPDVIEYFLAGASATAMGTIHFAEPRAARRILREIDRTLHKLGVTRLADLTGAMET